MDNKKYKLLFNFIVLSGIFLRLFKLTSQSVWIDEYITADLSSGPNIIYIFFNSLANNPHPPLFFILEYFIIKLFGISEFSIRLLPALFGIISIFVFYKVIRSFFSEKISFIALFLFCFNPYQIYYSQEARMYSLFMFITLIIIYYFILSIKYNSFLFWPFTLWSIAGLYTHNYTVLLLIILNFLIFIKYKEEIRMNLWIKSNIIILLFWLPLLLFFLKGLGGEGYSHKVNIFLAPLFTIKNHIFGLTIDFNLLTIIGLIIVLFLILNTILTNRDKTKKIINILTEILLLFILIPWIESIIGKPVYSDRTLIPIASIFLILISVGASYLSRNGLIIFLVLISFIYIISLNNYYFNKNYQKINYKEQFKKITEQYKEGDLLIHTYVNSYAAFEFYNKLKYKTGYENRLLREIPEFKGNNLQIFIREIWRVFKDNLKRNFKIDIYSGYDKNIMPETELKEKIKNLKRIWLISDNEIGRKRNWLPQGNIWNSNQNPGEDFSLEKFIVLKNFQPVQKIDYYGVSVYLLEKK